MFRIAQLVAYFATLPYFSRYFWLARNYVQYKLNTQEFSYSDLQGQHIHVLGPFELRILGPDEPTKILKLLIFMAQHIAPPNKAL